MSRMRLTVRRGVHAIFLLQILVLSALAQGAPRFDYTMAVKDASQHLFHIKTDVTNVSGKTLDIAIPAWTPGWYMIKPYAACVQRLSIHDHGKKLPFQALDKQSYRIDTNNVKALTIEYDYWANDLAVNGAELTDKHAFFIGTNIFFYALGHTQGTPSTLKFELPAGWRIATGLKRGNDPNTYTARDFDNLVDCPTVLGDFDEDVTTVQGKQIHVIIDPKGSLGEEARAKLKDLIGSIIDSQGKMFGGLPYEDYFVMYIGGQTLKGGGALEHENSTNIMRPIATGTNPQNLVGVVSHEHFHAWNVKRLKPAGLMPYNYVREQYTKELWFAEGVTSYYGDVHQLRAGINTSDQFVRQMAGQISGLQRTESRLYTSLSDSSTITWLSYGSGPGGPPVFAVNYYNKGEVVGFLLDLEIRGATKNQKSLDDVMRYLWENYYKKGRGYTNEDVEKAVSQIAGKSFSTFFARYVDGVDEIDYNAFLKNAGWKLEPGDTAAQFRIVEIEGASNEQKAVRAGLIAVPAKAQGAAR